MHSDVLRSARLRSPLFSHLSNTSSNNSRGAARLCAATGDGGPRAVCVPAANSRAHAHAACRLTRGCKAQAVGHSQAVELSSSRTAIQFRTNTYKSTRTFRRITVRHIHTQREKELETQQRAPEASEVRVSECDGCDCRIRVPASAALYLNV